MEQMVIKALIGTPLLVILIVVATVLALYYWDLSNEAKIDKTCSKLVKHCRDKKITKNSDKSSEGIPSGERELGLPLQTPLPKHWAEPTVTNSQTAQRCSIADHKCLCAMPY